MDAQHIEKQELTMCWIPNHLFEKRYRWDDVRAAGSVHFVFVCFLSSGSALCCSKFIPASISKLRVLVPLIILNLRRFWLSREIMAFKGQKRSKKRRSYLPSCVQKPRLRSKNRPLKARNLTCKRGKPLGSDIFLPFLPVAG